MSDQSQRIEVSATELRAMYAASDYPSRIAAGQLQPHVLYDRPLPGGGSSRIMAYTEPGDSTKRLVVHQRKRADGSQTQPDPKLLWSEVGIYWAR
jgi:hypothetical protein